MTDPNAPQIITWAKAGTACLALVGGLWGFWKKIVKSAMKPLALRVSNIESKLDEVRASGERRASDVVELREELRQEISGLTDKVGDVEKQLASLAGLNKAQSETLGRIETVLLSRK